jgi:hypothetical protein
MGQNFFIGKFRIYKLNQLNQIYGKNRRKRINIKRETCSHTD